MCRIVALHRETFSQRSSRDGPSMRQSIISVLTKSLWQLNGLPRNANGDIHCPRWMTPIITSIFIWPLVPFKTSVVDSFICLLCRSDCWPENQRSDEVRVGDGGKNKKKVMGRTQARWFMVGTLNTSATKVARGVWVLTEMFGQLQVRLTLLFVQLFRRFTSVGTPWLSLQRQHFVCNDTCKTDGAPARPRLRRSIRADQFMLTTFARHQHVQIATVRMSACRQMHLAQSTAAAEQPSVSR